MQHFASKITAYIIFRWTGIEIVDTMFYLNERQGVKQRTLESIATVFKLTTESAFFVGSIATIDDAIAEL